jgi:hypothetical protein
MFILDHGVGVQDRFQKPTLKLLKIRHRRKKNSGEISIKGNNYVFGIIIYAFKAKNLIFFLENFLLNCHRFSIIIFFSTFSLFLTAIVADMPLAILCASTVQQPERKQKKFLHQTT